MSDVVEAYRKKFGSNPENGSQLMKWSKGTATVRNLTFKEAKEAIAGASAKTDTSASATHSGATYSKSLPSAPTKSKAKTKSKAAASTEAGAKKTPATASAKATVGSAALSSMKEKKLKAASKKKKKETETGSTQTKAKPTAAFRRMASTTAVTSSPPTKGTSKMPPVFARMASAPSVHSVAVDTSLKQRTVDDSKALKPSLGRSQPASAGRGRDSRRLRGAMTRVLRFKSKGISASTSQTDIYKVLSKAHATLKMRQIVKIETSAVRGMALVQLDSLETATALLQASKRLPAFNGETATLNNTTRQSLIPGAMAHKSALKTAVDLEAAAGRRHKHSYSVPYVPAVLAQLTAKHSADDSSATFVPLKGATAHSAVESLERKDSDSGVHKGSGTRKGSGVHKGSGGDVVAAAMKPPKKGWNCSVERFEVLEKRAFFTLFIARSGVPHARIRRRYSQIEEFHSTMIGSADVLFVPLISAIKFPKKTFTRSLSDKFLRKRQSALQLYFVSLFDKLNALKINPIAISMFCNFFEIGPRPMRASAMDFPPPPPPPPPSS